MIPLRIEKLDLYDFKGFRVREGRPVEINLDADLVVIIGQNGRGKTSVVEALELAATGTIRQRVGDPKEFRLDYFIRRDSLDGARQTAEARVEATWGGAWGKDTITIRREARKDEGKVQAQGRWSESRQDSWADEGRANLLRSTAFLYSDALGAMLGLDLKARRQILDSYVPEGAKIAKLARMSTTLSAIGAGRRFIGQDLDDAKRKRDAEVSAARVVEQSCRALSKEVPVQLISKTGNMLAVAKLQSALRQISELVGASATDSSPSAIRDLASVVRTKMEVAQQLAEAETRQEAPANAERLVITERLRRIERELAGADVPISDQLAQRIDELGEEADLLAQKAECGQRIAQCRVELERLWSNQDGVLPSELGRCPVGILPLLASLAGLQTEDQLPAWWEEAGLPPPAPGRFATLLKREVECWRDLETRLRKEESAHQGLDERLRERRRLAQIAPLIHELEAAWLRLFPGRPLPTLGDGVLDTASLRNAIREPGSPEADRAREREMQAGRLRELADALERWAGAREQTVAAEERIQADGAQQRQKTADALDELARFFERLQGRGLSDLSTRLRARAVEKRYGRQMDEAMRRVLFGYAHPEHLVENAHARFDASGHFVVSIGDPEGAQTGIASLSRSQLTSVAFSLALAANLGLPEPPLGFVCLDDVSDAFDLDNLAADASILRMLAYGGSERARRQLILTNHNDELTNRIVPLLLPPANRTMRVVQLVGGGASSEVEVKQWRVRAEQSQESTARSPMQRFYPPARP